MAPGESPERDRKRAILQLAQLVFSSSFSPLTMPPSPSTVNPRWLYISHRHRYPHSETIRYATRVTECIRLTGSQLASRRIRCNIVFFSSGAVHLCGRSLGRAVSPHSRLFHPLDGIRMCPLYGDGVGAARDTQRGRRGERSAIRGATRGSPRGTCTLL